MSSTNRSKAREKHVADYYLTPVNVIVTFLKEFFRKEKSQEWAHTNGGAKILDPCAGGDREPSIGDGNKHPMSYPEALKQIGIPESSIDTCDIREDSLAKFKRNYLEWEEAKNQYDMIITNPPFNISIDIIQKALKDVKEGGFVVMLLRLNYFGSKGRKKFWEENPPKYAFIHNERISFTEDEKTDSIEYMHCVWQKGYKPEFTLTKVI